MRALRQLTLVDIKLYVREPIATFFTLAFPPMLVVLFGAMYGNAPSDLFGGLGSMDIAMPGYTALIVGTVGLLSIPITISGYRELGVLRRFQATPLRPISYIAADVLTNLFMTFLGMVALLIVGGLLYHVRFDGNPIAVIVAIVFCALTMFSAGYVIAGVAPSARTAQVIGMVIFYPLVFLSGATIPLEVMPESIRTVANFLPLTYVVRLLHGLWFGQSWSQLLPDTAILAVILVVCTALAARFFRWE
jgi:ABC-2 type transport system permease protein